MLFYEAGLAYGDLMLKVSGEQVRRRRGTKKGRFRSCASGLAVPEDRSLASVV